LTILSAARNEELKYTTLEEHKSTVFKIGSQPQEASNSRMEKKTQYGAL
jgi:hypothetical protein